MINCEYLIVQRVVLLVFHLTFNNLYPVSLTNNFTTCRLAEFLVEDFCNLDDASSKQHNVSKMQK